MKTMLQNKITAVLRSAGLCCYSVSASGTAKAGYVVKAADDKVAVEAKLTSAYIESHCLSEQYVQQSALLSVYANTLRSAGFTVVTRPFCLIVSSKD